MNRRERDENRPGSESEFVELLKGILGRPADRIRTGIGDDAAVCTGRDGYDLVFTSDSYVRGVHFDTRWGGYRLTGEKAMGSALSDMAAMGAEPVAALVSLGLPSGWGIEEIESLYRGIAECAGRYGCEVVGGETVRTNTDFVVTISILGEVEAGRALTRSGASPGDLLYVTGTLGANEAAVRCLKAGGGDETFSDRMRMTFFRIRPRIAESRFLSDRLRVSAMIDLSDGLSTDLFHLTDRSGVGAVVVESLIPVSDESDEAARLLGEDPVDYALHGGEDYELLFSVSGEIKDDIVEEFENLFHSPLTMIGEIIESGVYIEKSGGSREDLPPRGYDHLRRRSR